MKKVLAIDGGGIRGLIPALLLEHLEEEAGQPVSQLFDLVAGTSTGGILALGLVTPWEDGTPRYTAGELADLYRTEGSRIFHRSFGYWLRSAGNLADAKYPPKGIEEVLDRYFGESRLSEALTPVVVTSYEIERRVPWFFKSRKASDPELAGEYDFPMKKVGRATSAAPTYFDPLRLDAPEDETDYYALVDGGVYANNPAMCAWAEAQVMWPGEDILLVSLGTGKLTRRIALQKAERWGVAGWATPILDVVFDGVADTIDFQLRQVLPENRYYRYQVRLNEGNEGMDNTRKANLRELQLLAEGLIGERRQELNNLAGRLVAG
ncbi:MAG: patatin-like phospholipase family protein [Balneolaceae bacterium]|nr:patatin-like phospholipase family protein [Balneolaceae bacterium]